MVQGVLRSHEMLLMTMEAWAKYFEEPEERGSTQLKVQCSSSNSTFLVTCAPQVLSFEVNKTKLAGVVKRPKSISTFVSLKFPQSPQLYGYWIGQVRCGHTNF